MSDERIIVLLRQRSVRCTLRKSPHDISKWFYDTLKLYSDLWVRPDKDMEPIKGVINEMFTLLKFVVLPNSIPRKRNFIATRWPAVKERFDAL